MKDLLSLVLFFFGMVSSVFGQGCSFTFSEASNGAITTYPINPGSRGEDIVAMFAQLNTAPFKINGQSQVAIQTTNNGLITNVQAITPMTNHTILLIAYLLPSGQLPLGHVGKNASRVSQGFVAIPVEQIIEMIYSPTIMSTSSVFTSKVPGGILPIFSVDLAKRSADIQEAVTLLITPPIANAGTPFTPVSLLTTLGGPYYQGTANTAGAPIIVNGVIPQVEAVDPSIAPNGTLLLVTFKPLQSNPYLNTGASASVVVAPDQIFGIVFTQN